ncbi:hypothetical protein C8R47DRAFT_991086 [Mycena vitilis]|nr:hypothetical protein C8R47DRAFT_991086 [Mycena vitilis]
MELAARAASSGIDSLKKELEILQLASQAVTPRPDYALHSAGASVIPSLTSQTYTLRPSSVQRTIVGYFTGNGIRSGRPPITALHHDVHDGQCWPFAGTQGHLGIVLSAPLYIEEITIDHVAAAVAVNSGTSAPRDMELWALIEGQDNLARLQGWRAEMPLSRERKPTHPEILPKSPEYIRIASFQYDIHSPSNVQTFPVERDISSLGIDFGVVVLVIKSNWGMEEYTCLYRVRVHGRTM